MAGSLESAKDLFFICHCVFSIRVNGGNGVLSLLCEVINCEGHFCYVPTFYLSYT